MAPRRRYQALGAGGDGASSSSSGDSDADGGGGSAARAQQRRRRRPPTEEERALEARVRKQEARKAARRRVRARSLPPRHSVGTGEREEQRSASVRRAMARTRRQSKGARLSLRIGLSSFLGLLAAGRMRKAWCTGVDPESKSMHTNHIATPKIAHVRLCTHA